MRCNRWVNYLYWIVFHGALLCRRNSLRFINLRTIITSTWKCIKAKKKEQLLEFHIRGIILRLGCLNLRGAYVSGKHFLKVRRVKNTALSTTATRIQAQTQVPIILLNQKNIHQSLNFCPCFIFSSSYTYLFLQEFYNSFNKLRRWSWPVVNIVECNFSAFIAALRPLLLRHLRNGLKNWDVAGF